MPLKPIFETDIKGLDELNKHFEKYRAGVAQVPGLWARIKEKIEGARSSMKNMAVLGAAEVEREHIHNRALAVAEQRTLSIERATKKTSEHWYRIAKLVGVVSLGAAAGGFWALNALSQNAAARRREALGLGTSVGAQGAFDSAFGRFVSPEFLHATAAAQMDIRQRVGLYGAGLSQKEMTGDVTEVGTALLRHLKQIADNTDPRLFAQIITARKLDEFATPEQLRLLRGTSPEEFERQMAQQAAFAERLKIPDRILRGWQDMSTYLEFAGKNISRTFIMGLVPLAPKIEHLADSFTKALDAFLGSDALKKSIDALADGFDKIAEMVSAVSSGGGNTTKVLAAVTGALAGGRIGGLPGAAAGAVIGLMGAGAMDSDPDLAAQRQAAVSRAAKLRQDRASGKATIWSQLGDIFSHNLTQDQLLGLIQAREASGDTAISPKGAIGRYQIMPGTAQQYGADPSRLMDPAYNEMVARKIIADLSRQFGGNVSEIMAAYNAGPGVARRFRAAGDDPSVLPAETRKYISGIGAGVTVKIENNTGGNAVVSVNGLKN